MLRKFIAMGVALSAFSTTMMGQDSSKVSSLTFNGSADIYYRYDFAKTKANNLTSFTN